MLRDQRSLMSSLPPRLFGYHGKVLAGEDLERSLEGLGEVDRIAQGTLLSAEDRRPEQRRAGESEPPRYALGEEVATRKAYGRALVRLAERFPHLIALDAEVSNSTYAEALGKAHASAGWLDLRINPRPV
jgi:transketolase